MPADICFFLPWEARRSARSRHSPCSGFLRKRAAR
jgi:hypothetical protein